MDNAGVTTMENQTYDMRNIEALVDNFLDCFTDDGEDEVKIAGRGLDRVFEGCQKLVKAIVRYHQVANYPKLPDQWIVDSLEISQIVNSRSSTLPDIMKALEDTLALARTISNSHGWSCRITCKAKCKCGLPCGEHFKSQEDDQGNEREDLPPIPNPRTHRSTICDGLSVK